MTSKAILSLSYEDFSLNTITHSKNLPLIVSLQRCISNSPENIQLANKSAENQRILYVFLAWNKCVNLFFLEPCILYVIIVIIWAFLKWGGIPFAVKFPQPLCGSAAVNTSRDRENFSTKMLKVTFFFWWVMSHYIYNILYIYYIYNIYNIYIYNIYI